MSSPEKQRSVFRIIIFVIILRKIDLKSLSYISLIFSIQCHTVIFRMSHDKNLTSPLRHCKKKPRLLRFCKNRDIFTCTDIFDWNLCMSGMWCKKSIIKSSDQRDLTIQNFVPEETKHFVIELTFLKSVKMIQTCLCSPAQKNRRCHMTFCPVHDLCQLVPVIHFFKLHLFYRCSCHDHSIKLHIFEFRKSLIKFIQMIGRRIFCLMALNCHKSHVHL